MYAASDMEGGWAACSFPSVVQYYSSLHRPQTQYYTSYANNDIYDAMKTLASAVLLNVYATFKLILLTSFYVTHQLMLVLVMLLDVYISYLLHIPLTGIDYNYIMPMITLF